VPVLASLRRAYPSARIDWLVQDAFADAIWYHPALTNAIPFPRRQLSADLKRGRLGRVLRWLNHTFGDPEGGRYDLVLDCQGLWRSGLFAWWTGARTRVGYAAPEGREFSWLGVNRRVNVHKTGRGAMHAVDRMLELVKGAGVEPIRDMRLYTGPKERAFVERNLGGRRYALLAPTSRWSGKRWPAERFVEVSRALLSSGFEALAIVGSKSERSHCTPLIEYAASEPRVIDLIGGTYVGELMAVVQSAGLVIASDSAALHMAVGFDRPAVALYGPTRVELVGPYTAHSPTARTIVLQHAPPDPRDRAGHKNDEAGAAMMAKITVPEVVAAAAELMKKRS
jgi:heptosyltransferase-1